MTCRFAAGKNYLGSQESDPKEGSGGFWLYLTWRHTEVCTSASQRMLVESPVVNWKRPPRTAVRTRVLDPNEVIQLPMERVLTLPTPASCLHILQNIHSFEWKVRVLPSLISEKASGIPWRMQTLETVFRVVNTSGFSPIFAKLKAI